MKIETSRQLQNATLRGIVIICSLAVLATSTSALDESAHSGSDALTRLHQYTDSPAIEPKSDRSYGDLIIERIDGPAVMLPFSGSLIRDGSLWRIQIPAGIESLIGSSDLFSSNSKSALVLMDSTTGKLVHMRIVDSVIDVNRHYEVDAYDAQAQIEAVGESYVGLPDSLPVTKLADVLVSVKRLVRDAEVIDIDYVDWRHADKEARPVWIISVWGLPASQWHMPRGIYGVTYEQLRAVKDQDHQRLVIDANSGKVIKRTNVPRFPDEARVGGK